jgi:hypothetical protein
MRFAFGILMSLWPFRPGEMIPAIFADSFTEYFYAFALPWLQREFGVDEEEIFAEIDLRSIEDELRSMSHKIRIYASSNDFLRRPEDTQWLYDVFGEEHVVVLDGGGHLGNAWRPEVQQLVLADMASELEVMRAAAP